MYRIVNKYYKSEFKALIYISKQKFELIHQRREKLTESEKFVSVFHNKFVFSDLYKHHFYRNLSNNAKQLQTWNKNREQNLFCETSYNGVSLRYEFSSKIICCYFIKYISCFLFHVSLMCLRGSIWNNGSTPNIKKIGKDMETFYNFQRNHTSTRLRNSLSLFL